MLVALFLAAANATTMSSAAELPTLVTQVERAIVVGDLQRLRESRDMLLASLEETPDSRRRMERYTLAYVNWSINHVLEDADESQKERRALLKEAQAHLQMFVENDPDNAEAQALLGSVIGEQIGNSAWRGMRLGPRSGRAIDRAVALAPDNPRVALQRGISFLFTPRLFGGGLGKAETELRRAVTLYEKEDAAAPWPNWGRAEAYAWLGQALAKKGEIESARAVYRRALEVEPDYVWISSVLLPRLDR